MHLRYDLYTPTSLEEALAPIILLHSLIEDRKTWIHVAQDIANNTRRKVYAIDARNHGESPWTDEFTIDLMVGDLQEFFHQHKIPRAILLGHSIGAKVAMAFALNQSTMVEKLIIEDSTTKNFAPGGGEFVSESLRFVKEIADTLPTGDRVEVEKTVREQIRPFLPMAGIPSEVADTYDPGTFPAEWTGNKYVMQLNMNAIIDSLRYDKLQQNLSGVYNGEVLVLFGRKSVFKVYKDDGIPKLFPRAIFIEFQEASHFIHHLYPMIFVFEVSNFINSSIILQSKY